MRARGLFFEEGFPGSSIGAECMLALGNAVPFIGHLSIGAGIKNLFTVQMMFVANVTKFPRWHSSAGDCAECRFDRPHFFHRSRLAQLFQDQVTDSSKRPDVPNAK